LSNDKCFESTRVRLVHLVINTLSSYTVVFKNILVVKNLEKPYVYIKRNSVTDVGVSKQLHHINKVGVVVEKIGFSEL